MSIVGRKYYQVDINTSPARVQLGAIADGDLHEIDYEIKVFDGQAAVDCTGAQAAVYVVRADRQTVFWNAETGKNGVKFRMPEAAHAVAGRFAVAVRLTLSGVKHTVFLAEGSVITTRTDALVDPGHEVPDLDELLARIAEMEAKTAAASAAASTANAAAQYAIQTADAAAAGVDQKVADAVAPAIAVVNGMNDQVRQLEGTGKNHNARIANLEAAAKGYLYREDVDDETEYQKTVPDGAMPWASLDKVGGKTLVWNQLLQSKTINAQPVEVTVSGNHKDGISIVGTPSGSMNVNIGSLSFIQDHVYFVGCESDKICVTDSQTFNTSKGDRKVTAKTTGVVTFSFYIAPSEELNETVHPFVIDLTAMFGAGNEPTAEEFRAMFPADYYPYSEPTLMSFGADEVVSSSGQANDLSALVGKYFPDGMKSAGEVHDEIDLERGVAVKRVAEAVFTRSDINLQGTTKESNLWRVAIVESSRPKYAKCVSYCDGVCNKYTVGTSYATINTNNHYIGFNNGSGWTQFVIRDDSLTTSQEVVDSIEANPIHVAYPLETPIETPIDPADLAGLADLNVEAGGTITLTNQHGDDYRVPLPNQETYIIKLGGAAQ